MSDYKSNNDVAKINAQIQDVKLTMEENVVKVIKRGENLDQLGNKAQTLEKNADIFVKRTKEVKKKFQLKNLKWTIALITFLILLGLVIGTIIYFNVK